jgi:hypothetical protein
VRLDNITQQSIDRLQQLVQTLKSDETQTNPKYQKFVTNPAPIADIAAKFTTQKVKIETPNESTRPTVIEVPVLNQPIIEPINVVSEPVNYDDQEQQRERLKRLQEEMMYQQGGMGTRFDIPYRSPYATPTQTVTTSGGGGEPGGGFINERTSNDDYIRDFERRNIENIL